MAVARDGVVMMMVMRALRVRPPSRRRFVFGGQGASGDLLGDAYLLDIEAQRWVRVAATSGPSPRVFQVRAWVARVWRRE